MLAEILDPPSFDMPVAVKVAVSQLNVSSLSLGLGNVVVLHKDWVDAQRDDSQHFQKYYQFEVPSFLGMG